MFGKKGKNSKAEKSGKETTFEAPKSHLNQVLKTLWGITVGIILIGFIGVFAISQSWLGNLPEISDLQNPINKSASRVYSDDGKLLGTWSYASENRLMVTYDSLPENLVKALVATEDERFYDHSGIDLRAIGRAVVKRCIMRQKSAGGGSTITQQLAKQLYTDVSHNVVGRLMQKPNEWYIAVQLEKYYTKEEIITMYFNYFDFLNNAVGIKNAAKTYFNKAPIDMDLNECAILVGMCKNPSLYRPFKVLADGTKVENPRCKERRNVVLAQMYKNGYLSKEELQLAKEEPVDYSRFHVTTHKEGECQYFREYLRRIMMAQKPDRKNYASWQNAQFYGDSVAWENDPLYGWCNKNTKKDGTPYNIYTDGLKIYTSIDTRMQKLAEQAMFEHVAQYLQPAFEREIRGSSIAPYKGLSKSKFEKIIQRAMRQSERYRVLKESGYSEEDIEKSFNTPTRMELFTYGSSYDDPIIKEVTMTPRDSILYYKKFLRSAMCAIDPHNGKVRAYVPGLNFNYFQFDNVLGGGTRQVGSTIKPLLYNQALMVLDLTPCDAVVSEHRSYNGWSPKGSAMGHPQLKSALAQSNNPASVYLIDKIRPQTFVNYLANDLGINIGSFPRPANLTLALGSCDISVGQMASAYTMFPGDGVHVYPNLVTRIEDGEGNIIASFTPRMNEVMAKEKSWQMLYMMKAVINEGTGRSLHGTPYNINGDVAGKTGTTNDNADGWFMGVTPNLVVACWVGGDDRDIHFGSMAFGQGAKAALPIFGRFMRKVYNQNSKMKFGVAEADTFSIPRDYKFCSSDLDNLPPAIDPEPVEVIEIDDDF